MDHYFSPEPGVPDRRRTVSFQVGGRDYQLTSGSGVFSAGRLDPGTAVLLRKADLPDTHTGAGMLDLGCGYGPIACVLATVAPDAVVWAVDPNARARSLTASNAAKLGVADRVRVVAPDDLPADLTFDQIWSNPPVRVGKPELQGLLSRWLRRLGAGGVAWLVVGRHLGADSLQEWLRGQGWVVARHASQKGYRVLRVTRGDGG